MTVEDATRSTRRVHSLDEIAAMFGVSERSLRRRRRGDSIVFDDGRELKVIRNCRKTWVGDAELGRFLGEQRRAVAQ